MDKFLNDTIIVTNHFLENLDWLIKYKDLFKNIVVCNKIGAEEMSKDVLNNLDCKSCPTMQNKGKEATAYLNYIINNYENLPNKIAFIHGHEYAWHQSGPYNLISMILRAKVDEYGYVSLNNNFLPLSTNKNYIFNLLKKYWKDYFYEYLGELPNEFIHDCCAQFIVSKELILKHPKQAYQKWYNLCNIINSNKEDEKDENYAIMFEYIWYIIFKERGVFSMSNKEYYSSTRFYLKDIYNILKNKTLCK